MMSNAYSIAGSESIRRAKIGPKWTLRTRQGVLEIAVPRGAFRIELAERGAHGTQVFRFPCRMMPIFFVSKRTKAWRFV